ncbi:MAG TPA: hypothetical protein VHN20_07445 [Beijerinckiaceae bacterium]|nr:hypothetical protein [Beijerinckiaceae bacterium]
MKRGDILKLTALTRVQFDTRARRGHLPSVSPDDAEGENDSELPRSDYRARDALATIVMDDLVRSGWGQQDLSGAARLVAKGMETLGPQNVARLATSNPRDELWLGAALIRYPGDEIVRLEAAASLPMATDHDRNELRDILLGHEAPIIGTLAEIVFDALGYEGLSATRLIAVNLSAAYRLLQARAAQHGIDLPSDLAEYAS